MLWRELKQRGDERFKRATSVGLSWELERKSTIPGWDFGGYAWTFAKSRSSVIVTRSSARQRSENTESPAPRVPHRRPYPLRSLHREGSMRILMEDSRRL